VTDIGWSGLAVSFLLVMVAALLSVWRHLGLETTIIWASIRAIVQLLAVGGALELLLRPETSIAWSFLWVAGMVVFAAATVQRRAREVPQLFLLALSAFGVAAVVVLGVLFGLGVFTLDARTLIPLAGLMIGNSMTATVLVARRVFEELRDKRDEVEARLALGQTSWDAAAPYVRHSLRTALIPQIRSTPCSFRLRSCTWCSPRSRRRRRSSPSACGVDSSPGTTASSALHGWGPDDVYRPALGFRPWFALLRRALSLRFFVFLDTSEPRGGRARRSAGSVSGGARLSERCGGAGPGGPRRAPTGSCGAS
jgi:putative ABC transport system permease protein